MTYPDRHFGDDEPIGDAREWLREQAADTGARCPCCTQNVKIYRRPLGVGMAVDAITAWRSAGHEDFHAPTVLHNRAGDFAKLRYWRIIDDLGEVREDGGKAGWWRFTDLGHEWVRGLVGVPRYVYVFDGRFLRFDKDGPQSWTIRDALGDRFDLAELMATPGRTLPPI